MVWWKAPLSDFQPSTPLMATTFVLNNVVGWQHHLCWVSLLGMQHDFGKLACNNEKKKKKNNLQYCKTFSTSNKKILVDSKGIKSSLLACK